MPEKKSEIKTEKIEKEYVIPLRSKFKHVVRYKKTPKAVKSVKEFLVRHMKIYDRDLNKIKLDNDLNDFLWMRGIKNPPSKIKVKVVKDGENFRVELVDLPDKFKFKKAREEKIEKEAKDAVAKKKTMMQKVKEGIQKPKEEKKEESESGIEKKEEAREKAKAGAEESMKLEKAAAKTVKHSAGGKTKEPKRQQRKALAK